jgi:hypothetical protein
MITVYDHNTHPTWAHVYQMTFGSIGRTNGAYTYSEEIVKYHLPVIKDVLEKQKKYNNILICTVGFIEQSIKVDSDLIIIYLHENLDRESVRCLDLKKWCNKDIIYITARLDLYNWLIDSGFKAVHLPMSIDTEYISEFIKSDKDKYIEKRVVWFGNKYMGKDKSLKDVKSAFIRKGWNFDELCFNRLNHGYRLSKKECINVLSKYKYGIGVARCYLEMNSLGLKCLIASTDFNGIITNDAEYKKQKDNNFVGKDDFYTFSNNISDCIDNIDNIMVKSLDVREVLPILEKQLKDILL